MKNVTYYKVPQLLAKNPHKQQRATEGYTIATSSVNLQDFRDEKQEFKNLPAD